MDLLLSQLGGVAMSRSIDRWVQYRWWATIGLLCAVALGSVAWRMARHGYTPEDLLPRRQFEVHYDLSFDGHERAVRVRTFLPDTDERQTVSHLGTAAGPGLVMSIDRDGLNRRAQWGGRTVADGERISYRVSVAAVEQQFDIEPTIPVQEQLSAELLPYVASTDRVQAHHHEVHDALVRIGAHEGPLLPRLEAIYSFVQRLGAESFKGETDALTALRLGAASCNGKSRLFTAFARAAGIPARLVGGLVMEPGTKRTTHQWVEAYIGGHWVPFDATNGHFAALPAHYLVLYRGDEALFRHTRDIGFDYRFAIASTQVPPTLVDPSIGGFELWKMFERLSLPFSLLRTLLMLPAGALIVVFFRNVVGLPTYGTFLPALIAVSVGDAGLAWSLLCLLVVLAGVTLVRVFVERLQLLHSPTLALVLSMVTLCMLGASVVADSTGHVDLARASFFPVAVLAIASERFYMTSSERGLKEALTILAGTLVVVMACSLVMHSLAMQVLMSAFPELLLLVVAGNVYLGRWVGMRLTEYIRFSPVLAGGAA